MRVNEPPRSLLRRPVMLLLMLGVAGGGAAFGWTHATPSYTSDASVIVVSAGSDAASQAAAPDETATPNDANAAQLALVVGSQLVSDPVRDQVVAAGGDPAYKAGTFGGDGAEAGTLSPMIDIAVTSATAGGAQRAIDVLITQASAQLAAVQSAANVPPESRAHAVEARPASPSAVVGGPQLRAAGTWALVGALAVVVLAAATSALFGRTSTPESVRTFVTPNGVAMHAGPPVLPASEPQGADGLHGPGRFVTPDVEVLRAASPDAGTAENEQTIAATPERPARRRQQVIRDMVRDDWRRNGNDIPWTRAQQRAAYQRAEDSLAELEHRRRDADAEKVSRFDDFSTGGQPVPQAWPRDPEISDQIAQ